MTPSVDWVRFLALMEGQCEPGFSSYEISKKRVRLANIDPELWFEEGATRVFTARVNTIEGGVETRTVTTAYTPEEAARAMSGWRVTQQESVLKFPCYPSDVKRWAEEQFLEIGQELEDACNDETLERLAEAMEPPATLTVLRGGQAGGETESLAMALEEPPAVPVKTYQAQRTTTQKRAEWMERILAALCELDPDFDTKSMHGRKVDLLDMCKALVPRYFNIGIGCFEDTALKGRTVFLPGARGTTYYRNHLEAVRLKLGLNSPRPSRITG